ncbi:hypothetical protein ACSS6W_008159 [Trichoderma asperelloides]
MALIGDAASTEWVTIFITCAFLIILVPTYRLLFHPLAVLPGPKLAALSSWWQIRKIIAGKPYELALHDRYGPIVRTAPNEVVCNSKEAFEVLYNGTRLSASVLELFIRRPHSDGVHLLAETDMMRYQLFRRSAGPAFTASNLKRFKPKVIEVMQKVCERLHRLNGEEVDTSEWMHIIVLECLTSITWSGSPENILEQGHNHGDLELNLTFWRRTSVLGHLPTLRILLDIIPMLRKHIFQILDLPTSYSSQGIGLPAHIGPECRGERVPVGFEDRPSTITSACVREAMRLHHVTNISLSRVAPRDGLQLHGYFLPEGTVLGCNPTTFARNTDLFGPDAREFKPERWLSGDEDHIKTMERYNLLFGGQSRNCPGQNLAKLIISSVVPRLFRNFDIQVKVPEGGFDNYPPQFWTMLSGSKIRFVSR